jgi:hypothetical protein
MTNRLALLLVTVIGLLPQAANQQSRIDYGDDVRIPLPHIAQILMQIASNARLSVLVRAGSVDDVVLLEPEQHGSAAEFLHTANRAYLRTWEFSAGEERAFETSVRVRYDQNRPQCVNNDKFSVVATPPVSIEFITWPLVICDPSGPDASTAVVVREIAGRVRCACSGQQPVPDASVRVRVLSDVVHVVPVNRDGRFRKGVAPGTYRVEVNAAGYEPWVGFVVIDPNAGATLGDITLTPQAPRLAYTPPSATVSSAMLAAYPVEARRSGLEGTVRLQLAIRNEAVVNVDAGSDDSIIARAAVQNARTWKFARSTVSVLPVTYTFRLLPGDCSPDQRPTITMSFPDRVELVAKRLIPCG